jgi:hypothetical protein
MSAVLAPDPGPIARLEAVIAQEHTQSVVFQRVADGETLRDIARAWQVPVGRFAEWYMTEHGDRYDAALRVLAGEDAHETVKIADETTPEDVAQNKLRIDARKWRAGKYDRNRYGEQVQHQVSGRAVLKVDFARPGEREIEPELEVVESVKISALGKI